MLASPPRYTKYSKHCRRQFARLGQGQGDKAQVAAHFITPSGHQVYPLQIDGRMVWMTEPEV